MRCQINRANQVVVEELKLGILGHQLLCPVAGSRNTHNAASSKFTKLSIEALGYIRHNDQRLAV